MQAQSVIKCWAAYSYMYSSAGPSTLRRDFCTDVIPSTHTLSLVDPLEQMVNIDWKFEGMVVDNPNLETYEDGNEHVMLDKLSKDA